MALRRFIALTCLTLSTFAFSQQPPQKPAFPWTVLTDPACPVASPSAPNTTRELRVLYFPQGRQSKLKNPESLMLYIGYNYPGGKGSSIPFARKDDHWEAPIPIESVRPYYAIFYVKDEKTGEVDDNGGKLWDMKFCDPRGERNATNIQLDAQSYSGASWGKNLHRPKDLNKAISILEAGNAQNPNMQFWFNDLWTFKAQRDGDDPQAWFKLSKEIVQYLSDHPKDPEAAMVVGNFVVWRQDKFSADFVDQLVDKIDAQVPSRPTLGTGKKHSYRSDLEYSRALHQPDDRSRLAAIDAFIAKYPDSIQAEYAQESRFSMLVSLGDVPGAEAAFAKYRELTTREKDRLNDPNIHNAYFSMARLYLDKGVKIDQALLLVDQGLQAFNKVPDFANGNFDSFRKSVSAEAAELRARAYLALKKPDLALTEARKSLELNSDNPDTHFFMAEALAGRDKQKALEEYFEAALMPSNKDLEYGAALRKFYLEKRFGSPDQFSAELQKRKHERFLASHYVPELVDKAAPKFEFSTLKGEKFDAASLGAKSIVVNFWSPG